MNVQTILIRDINFDHLIVAGDHGQLKVARLAAALKEGRPVPPVLVARNAGVDKKEAVGFGERQASRASAH